MKKCNNCLEEKEIDMFPKKGAKCKCCVAIYKKEYAEKNKDKIVEYKKDYYLNNSEFVKSKVKIYAENNSDKIKLKKSEYNKNNPNTDYHKRYREENKDLISQKRKEYYLNNSEFIKGKVKEYANENRDEINSRRKEKRDNNKDYYNEKLRVYIKNKKDNDSLYKLKCNIRGLITQSFKGQYTKKAKKTVEILGCDFDTFKIYIESQFTENMNWDNYADYWQLDHKKPISWAENEEDVYLLNHYTNFQPLYWLDNIRKGNRWED